MKGEAPEIYFQATPYTIGTWTVLRLPMNASVKLPSRSQVMVEGMINGVAFKAPLEPDGKHSHWLNITKDLQHSAKVAAGKAARLTIAATKDWPEPELPADWEAALKADLRVQKLWDSVTPMARWEWLRWIGSTKDPVTRKRRIEVSCSKLLHGLRRPCCFNRAMCCIPDVAKNGVLIDVG